MELADSVGADVRNDLLSRPNLIMRNKRMSFRYHPTVDYVADVSVDFGTINTFLTLHCLGWRHAIAYALLIFTRANTG